MLLETLKSLATHFKKHTSSRETVGKPVPPSTEAQPVVHRLPVTPSNGGLTLHPSSSQTQMPPAQMPNSASAPGFLAYSHHNIMNNPTMVSVSNTFETGGGAIMQLLETRTIRGAEHDSSARYPPPKCHQETRQTLRHDIFDWIMDPLRSWRMFYILGPAGVGKSAVAQTVADDCKEADCLGASCFISRPNHRNDPDGIIPTLAYQLAVKHEVYKRIISHKLAHDPTILRKARRVQFKELLIDPFHTIMIQDASAIRKPLLIIIDGVDECESQGAQCEFIELIGDHVRSFPDFPLLWLICSRPESHLKYALSQADFQVTCGREEISVDDEEGQRDVFIYLQSEFQSIRRQYQNSLDDDWPPGDELLRIARAASGLFAFASTIIRFVGDADAGDPSNQLQACITILEGSNMPGVENPYLSLDLLYRHILASIPSKVLPTTMRILGMSIFYPQHHGYQSARTQANFLRIRMATFDHALKQLHSVLRIGSSPDAFDDPIEFYHASFSDFLRNPDRSGEFYLDEAAIHYDIALTSLGWLMGLECETQKGDIWVSPSEDVRICLNSVKSLSLAVLWKACSRVEGDNAINLYKELQKFNFNVLDHDILAEWEFGKFLGWLNRLECLLTPNDEIRFTEATVEQRSLSGFAPERFITRDHWDTLKKFHFNLGHEGRCRHIHIIVISDYGRFDPSDYEDPAVWSAPLGAVHHPSEFSRASTACKSHYGINDDHD